MTFKSWIVLSGLLWVCTLAWAADQTIGQAAPDFTLNDTGGNAHSLSDYAGQYVVLEWINHDCPFVRKHYGSGNMQALQREYSDVVWFSIASSAEGKQGHYSAHEWDHLTHETGASPTHVLLDPEGNVGRLYSAKTTPHMFIIDPAGALIYKGAIDDTPSADPNDVAGATNYVRLALDAALGGEEIEVSSTKPYGCSVKY